MGDCICDQFTAPVLDYQDAVGRLGCYRDIWAKFGRRWVGCINWMPVAKCTILGGRGGGLGCYYQIETDDPAAWLLGAERRISDLQDGESAG